jgi:NADH pyrophosphatase NudC (nudix superfamily)
MAEAGDKKRGFILSYIEAFRSYAEERKRPRVCPACGHEVTPIGDGKLFACSNGSCGWQGPTPDRG